jgi:hypothetical protein
MTRTLLAIAALGAIVCVISFSILHMIGGMDRMFSGHRWRHGNHSFVADDEAYPQTTRDLPWTGSEALHIDNSAATITYIQGPTPKFTVAGPKYRIDALNLTGDTLTGADIHWSFSDHHSDEIHITITSPNTHRWFLSGAETMVLTGYDQDSLEMHLSGAGHVRGVGKAKRLDADISGAGNLDFAALPVDDAQVRISGAGNATLDPKQSADLSISGAGHIGLLTKPANLHSSIAGFGSITTPDGVKIGKGGAKKDKNDQEDD